MSYLDKTLVSVRLVDGNSSSLLEAATHILKTCEHITVGEVLSTLHNLPVVRSRPINSGTTAHFSWNEWHHGQHFKLCAAGDETLLQRCALTDTEREQLSLAIRRAGTYEQEICVVASAITVTSSEKLPHNMTCIGIIFCH